MESFSCEYCCLQLNSLATLQAHLAGKKHRRQKAIVEQRWNESARSIFVSNLPLITNLKLLLRTYFQKFGAVECVVLMKFSAIVKFTSESSVNDVLLRSHHFVEGKRLMVKKKRFELPLPIRNKEECEQTIACEEIRNKHLRETIRKYPSVEVQMIILHTELKLRGDSMIARQEIRNVVFSVLSHYFPNSELHLFGSSANGFGFEGCDVDLHLKLPESWSNLDDDKLTESVPAINDIETSNVELLSNSAKLKLIRKIIKRDITNVGQIVFIPSLRCPLLRFKYQHQRYTGQLICDLTIGKGISLRNTKLLLVYGQLDSRILLLTTTLRWWAKYHQLINSDSKLTSYAFIFMVIFFLQNVDPPLVPSVEELAALSETKCVIDSWDCSFCENLNKIPKSANEQSVGELLKNFFKFYANFDFTTIISPRLGHGIQHQSLSSDCSLKEFKIGPVSIQDPFILNCNVAGKFKSKHLPDFIAKLSFCAELLSKGGQHAQGSDHGVAALLREIPTENDATEPLFFLVTSKGNVLISDTSLPATLAKQEAVTNWFKMICTMVKSILVKALCCDYEVILNSLKESELHLTRKRSHSFSNEDKKEQKHFMSDLVLKERVIADHPAISPSVVSYAESSEQSAFPSVKTGDRETVSTSNNENFPTKHDEFSNDVEMKNSEMQSNISSLQSDNPATCQPNNEILLHLKCKAHDNIWHQRKKISKTYKLDKRDILDIEHEISQEIIKQHGNNKYFVFDCQLQKHLVGGIINVKCEFKAIGKNSYEKLRQFIVPFVSKLVNKHMIK